MQLNKKKLAQTKVVTHPQYDSVKVTIRPFSLFALNQTPSSERLESVTEYFNIFNYSIVNWEGVLDEDSEVLKCNPENKKLMFDADFPFAVQIVHEAIEMRSGLVTEEERKNYPPSLDGEEHVSEK